MSLQLVDIGKPEVVTEADWTILADPQVESVAQAVARGFARDYGLTLEYEDAYQETVIIAAERAAYVRQLLAEAGAGLLHRWLSQRLRDRWLTEAKHRSGHVSYEAARHAAERTGQ
ncbi:hypothetical protein GCM10010211_49150 [Streptomyces albospinus]|uniref:Uncharacterized protein n=2 Tax=Streptomyces TaxID=1883 RepID=A0A101PBT1_9ACTN|nr:MULTISPECIES: hypothetical protein [Streptomyces]KUN08568.1 hypothetical protein AQI95_09435 [Streptomyces yokosukanensis]GGU77398.1 hypothetical protein GCM10010211_49150 [Streptomyces albospinus]